MSTAVITPLAIARMLLAIVAEFTRVGHPLGSTLIGGGC